VRPANLLQARASKSNDNDNDNEGRFVRNLTEPFWPKIM
jgi:hypothetical protein